MTGWYPPTITSYTTTCDLTPPREGVQPDPQAGCRAAVDIVPHLIPDGGELGHRRAHKALLEAGVTAEQESEHGDHDQQQGKQREGVVGDHRGQRGAVVVTELAHDRQREAQPPATLLRTVNRPQQPWTGCLSAHHPRSQDRLVLPDRKLMV
jgi:hypothetical protein